MKFLVLLGLAAALPSPSHHTLTPDEGAGKHRFSVHQNDAGKFVVTPSLGQPLDGIATGYYDDTIEATGWAQFYVKTDPSYSDEQQVAAAGFLEGYLTASRIYKHAFNTGCVVPKFNDRLKEYLAQNDLFMKSMTADKAEWNPEDLHDTIWWQVRLLLTQLANIYAGYKEAAQPGEDSLTYDSLVCLNLAGDLEDLEVALSDDDALMSDPFQRGRGRCSALVRLTANNADLLVSQTTWSTLETMTRFYKLYDVAVHTTNSPLAPVVGAQRVALSGYPGVLFSGDDFYVLSSGLIVQETTIGNSNPELYRKFVQPKCVLEWIRNVVANRLARNAVEWGQVFSEYNSGTYNNQNMIVDFNLFNPSSAELVDNTFHVCEQIPGLVYCRDMSQELATKGYFGSYNVALDPYIRNISGVDAAMAKHGDWFDYNKHPRAQIFARDVGKVQDIGSLKRLMRYNDYTNDPLSSQLPSCQYANITNCDPPFTAENAISCRSDLNPEDGVYAFGSLGHRNHVATDAKLTAFSIYDPFSLTSHAVSGPTAEQVPAFVFSQSKFKHVNHLGLPDVWNFSWCEFEWESV